MWLITTFGYFSVVQKNADRSAGLVTVRARIRKDLDRLRDRYLPSMGEVDEGGGKDYPYRVKVSREAMAGAFYEAIMDLDYSNFKAATAAELGFKREDAYMQVWLELRKLQHLDRSADSSADEASDSGMPMEPATAAANSST